MREHWRCGVLRTDVQTDVLVAFPPLRRCHDLRPDRIENGSAGGYERPDQSFAAGPGSGYALRFRKIDRTAALESFRYSGGQIEETALYGLLNGFPRGCLSGYANARRSPRRHGSELTPATECRPVSSSSRREAGEGHVGVALLSQAGASDSARWGGVWKD